MHRSVEEGQPSHLGRSEGAVHVNRPEEVRPARQLESRESKAGAAGGDGAGAHRLDLSLVGLSAGGDEPKGGGGLARRHKEIVEHPQQVVGL